MLLEGAKALITGSRRGIGSEIAIKLAEEGADIGLNDIEYDQSAIDTMKKIDGIGSNTSWHLADIADAEQVNNMFDEFLSVHGRIDILVNNAVARRVKSLMEISEEDWDLEIGSGLKGYFMCSQRAAKEMISQCTGGNIVSISSIHAFAAFPDDLVYGVCKAGIIRMTKSLALDLSGHNIKANCIAPGYIDSRLLDPKDEHLRGKADHYQKVMHTIPSRRAGLPSDIAGTAVLLCSSYADYVNGECITVDGGYMAGLYTPEV